MNTLRKLEADWWEQVANHEALRPSGACESCGVLNRCQQELSSAIPAWERLEKAARELARLEPEKDDDDVELIAARIELREALEGVKAK